MKNRKTGMVKYRRKDMKNGIIYQIFPDRFFIGNGKNIEDKRELYHKEAVLKQWDEKIEKENMHYHFFGGDIFGIIEKLEYIKERGADWIYINPVFPATTYHRYDSVDYKNIDENLGGMESFELLIKTAHEMGVKVVIDIALNHLSSSHPYFKEAVSNPDSKYRNYFTFKDYPETYECWWGVDYLPELNYKNSDVVEEFITGEESVIKFWGRKGVDGIRLDCANDLGVELCLMIKQAAREVNPDIIVVGEVYSYAAEWTYVLDSVQSYYITDTIYSLLKNRITAAQFGKNIERLYRESDKKGLLNSFVMLSSHDHKRALTAVEGDVEKYRQAVLLQFTLPGIPKIYYGEEVGMIGDSDPYNRAPMVWESSKWDMEIRKMYDSVVKVRRERVELQEGELIELSESTGNGVIVYIRYMKESRKDYSIIVINSVNKEQDVRVFLPYSFIFSDMKLDNLLGTDYVRTTGSFMDINLKPNECRVYAPDYLYKENYNFYKR